MDKKEETMVGSYLGWAGHSLEPITKFAGFNWKINIGLISSFAAKENVVGVLGSIYQSEEGETLEKYNNSYRDYMKKVPRYFLFF